MELKMSYETLTECYYNARKALIEAEELNRRWNTIATKTDALRARRVYNELEQLFNEV